MTAIPRRKRTPFAKRRRRVRREARPLTRREYDNSIVDLLGDPSHLSLTFPPENEVRGFRNNAAANPANPLLVESYLNAAEAIAEHAVSTNLDGIAPCPEGTRSPAGKLSCARSARGRSRRPIEEAEAAAFDRLFGATLGERLRGGGRGDPYRHAAEPSVSVSCRGLCGAHA